ncbi:MAG: hypothetical protein AB1304_11710 [Bacteroidota bacterium]
MYNLKNAKQIYIRDAQGNVMAIYTQKQKTSLFFDAVPVGSYEGFYVDFPKGRLRF